MKDGEQLDEFCLKLNGLVTNIRALGEDIEESYVVKKLFRAMPSKFLQIVSTIEQFGDIETMSVEEAIGSLKAHEERMKGQNEGSRGQLLLTEDEWSKRENSEGKLLLTREEWIKRNGRGGNDGASSQRFRGKDRGRDKSRVRCFSCGILGHYATNCRKSEREKDQKQEVNITQIEDDKPALLLTEKDGKVDDLMLLNEENVVPKLGKIGEREKSNLWYLDNGASNHMTGQRTKFRKLDESVMGQVKFGDGSIVDIK